MILVFFCDFFEGYDVTVGESTEGRVTGSESSLRFIHAWGREPEATIFPTNRTVFAKLCSNFIVFRSFGTVPLQQAS